MKATEVLKRIMTELSSVKEEAVEVKFEQMTLENGTILEADAFEAGNEVFIVNEEERIALPIGEYTLADGRMLYVAEEGIIGEVKSAEEEVAEEVAEVTAEPNAQMDSAEPKKVVESHTTETHFEENAPEVVEEELAEEVPMEDQVRAIVSPMIEEIKAELSAIREEMGSYKEKMSAVEQENETLKTELSSQSAAKPIKHNPENAPKAEVKLANRRPMNSLDRVMSKLNK